MNILTGESSDEFFGGPVPEGIRALLHRAASAAAEERGALLWTAQALAPGCLACYYALYKHHSGRREFEQAERAAWRGLKEAALQAGIAIDWRAAPTPLPAELRDTTAGRFWLFTLKALAFIHLRSGRRAEARQLLEQLLACHPQSGNGVEVTQALLDGLGDGA